MFVFTRGMRKWAIARVVFIILGIAVLWYAATMNGFRNVWIPALVSLYLSAYGGYHAVSGVRAWRRAKAEDLALYERILMLLEQIRVSCADDVSKLRVDVSATEFVEVSWAPYLFKSWCYRVSAIGRCGQGFLLPASYAFPASRSGYVPYCRVDTSYQDGTNNSGDSLYDEYYRLLCGEERDPDTHRASRANLEVIQQMLSRVLAKRESQRA